MEGASPTCALAECALSSHAGLVILALTESVWGSSTIARIVLVIIGLTTAVQGYLIAQVRADRKGSVGHAVAATVGGLFAVLGAFGGGSTIDVVLFLAFGHASYRVTQILRSHNYILDAHELKAAVGGARVPRHLPPPPSSIFPLERRTETKTNGTHDHIGGVSNDESGTTNGKNGEKFGATLPAVGDGGERSSELAVRLCGPGKVPAWLYKTAWACNRWTADLTLPTLPRGLRRVVGHFLGTCFALFGKPALRFCGFPTPEAFAQRLRLSKSMQYGATFVLLILAVFPFTPLSHLRATTVISLVRGGRPLSAASLLLVVAVFSTYLMHIVFSRVLHPARFRHKSIAPSRDPDLLETGRSTGRPAGRSAGRPVRTAASKAPVSTKQKKRGR